jgi:hypothetical protein
MQTRMCNLAIWTLVLIAILLLTLQGRMGLLAVVLPISLFLACVLGGRGTTRLSAAKPEKR